MPLCAKFCLSHGLQCQRRFGPQKPLELTCSALFSTPATLAAVLRQLAQEGSAEFVGYQNSVLMQLLSGQSLEGVKLGLLLRSRRG